MYNAHPEYKGGYDIRLTSRRRNRDDRRDRDRDSRDNKDKKKRSRSRSRDRDGKKRKDRKDKRNRSKSRSEENYDRKVFQMTSEERRAMIATMAENEAIPPNVSANETQDQQVSDHFQGLADSNQKGEPQKQE